MKIPAPVSSPSLFPAAGEWPCDKAGVLTLAQAWYDPSRVSIDEAALRNLQLPRMAAGADASMLQGDQPKARAERLARVVALNSLNYQFWDMQGGEFTRYARGGVVGALGMKAAFDEAWAPGGALDEARRGHRAIDAGLVREVFGDIPNLDSRVAVLQDVLAPGKLEKLSQELAGALDKEPCYDTRLASRLAEAMPVAYADPVLKKAQLALSEAWVQEQDQGMSTRCELTAFADYQIPNILRAMGVLVYNDNLAERIGKQELLPYGGLDECAIRAASLLAVEAIAAQQNVPVAAVDHYLWTRRKEAVTPFHLTVTTAY
jgi:hypothetical protein